VAASRLAPFDPANRQHLNRRLDEARWCLWVGGSRGGACRLAPG